MLWSQKSPDFPPLKQTLERQFATQNISAANLNFSQVKIEAERASLRVALDLTTTDLKTNQAQTARTVRSVALVREAEAWRIGQNLSMFDALTRQLADGTRS